MDQNLVAPLLDRVMTWIEDGVPVEIIAIRVAATCPTRRTASA